MASAAIIAVCARMFWTLRKYLLFWLVLLIVSLCNGALVVLVPWSSTAYPGIVLLPVALPVFGLVYGALGLVEKACNGLPKRRRAF
jgi:hypothetical protein